MPYRALALALALARASAPAAAETEWPTRGWRISTPAEEAVDPTALDELDRELAGGKHGYVDSMLVIRNGRVVYEKFHRNDYVRLFEGKDPTRGPYNYYDPDWHPYYRGGSLHTMQSVSKSVTSALIGIAIRDGRIPGVGVEALPYFDGYRTRSSDPRWRKLTLRDLLTMTSGIEWDESTVDYTDPRNSCARMEASENWVQFVLDRPMAEEPGKTFVYNSGVTELLGEILRKATGKDPDDYAAEHLFAPLGIERWYWKKTPTGLSDTEGGLYLEARDLAKIGYLYLHDGVWEGKRILPEGWVRDSTTGHVDASGSSERRYGYQWWLLPYGDGSRWASAGLGYGGQFLFVVPEQDLVAVFTGWNIYEGPSFPASLALERVLASVRSRAEDDVLYVWAWDTRTRSRATSSPSWTSLPGR
jgi:CubicO group peptidase (beta-lactamase class C family)